VELKNNSAVPLSIEWDCDPLQYLDLQVTDQSGKVVSECKYGHLFSPTGRTIVLELMPGQLYKHSVHLLGTVPRKNWKSGAYTIQATYQYRSYRAVSDQLRIQLQSDLQLQKE